MVQCSYEEMSEMPNPNQNLKDLGLWEKWRLPTKNVEEVLRHLATSGDPEPRLFVQEERGRIQASLTHSAERMGWNTSIDVRSIITSGFVEIDEEWTRKSLPSITAYALSNKGREVLAQMAAYEALENLLNKEVPEILERQRRIFGAPRPAK